MTEDKKMTLFLRLTESDNTGCYDDCDWNTISQTVRIIDSVAEYGLDDDDDDGIKYQYTVSRVILVTGTGGDYATSFEDLGKIQLCYLQPYTGELTTPFDKLYLDSSHWRLSTPREFSHVILRYVHYMWLITF